MGTRTKVQAKAKLDQVQEARGTERRGARDIWLEVWSWSIQGTTTEPDCYGLAPVLKDSDDKSDYNFVISVVCASLYRSKLLIFGS
jgi:hypothetical protein